MKSVLLRLAAVALFISFSNSHIFAALITIPAGLNPGDSYRLAFVSSGTISATSSDINVYNTFVQNAANAAPQLSSLNTTWRAIVSTVGIDARDNTGTNPAVTGVPIYSVGGPQIAASYVDLWDGTIGAPIFHDETDNNQNGAHVWTGSSNDGTGFAGGTVGSLNPTVRGLAGSINGAGFTITLDDPTLSLHLYAISAPLTVGSTAVPEPTSMALLGFGLFACGGRAYRRRRKAAKNQDHS